jgi:ubiquinone/menaquinone biosynthesis C-methylase UbiE
MADTDDRDEAAIHRQAKAHFAKTAAGYVSSALHARGDDLALLVAQAGEIAGLRALDVATGGGHTALALARAGAEVVATDLTPAMLEQASALIARELGVAERVSFVEAAAEALPFEDEAFDLVTCRIAAHHFAAPQRFVREAARVLKPGGKLLLIDNVSPEAPELAAALNRLEKLRDASHVEAYPVSRWIGWLAEAGFDLVHLARWWVGKDASAWLARAGADEAAKATFEAAVRELSPRVQAYLGAEWRGGRLKHLRHEAALLVTRKGELAAS